MGSIGKVTGIAGNGSVQNEEGIRTDRRLYSKDQADEFTKDYTPEQFLGKIDSYYMNMASLKMAADSYAPNTLDIGGYTFRKMGDAQTSFETKGTRETDVVMLEYQSTEQVGQEYPVLQVGIRVWRTKSGRVKSEIIRDGYTHKTRFW